MSGSATEVRKLEALKKQIATCAKNADALIALNKAPAKKAPAKKAAAKKAPAKKAGAKKPAKKAGAKKPAKK